MPSVSKSQQRLFGWVLACKRGKSKDCPEHIQTLADKMSEEDIKKYAETEHEGLPSKIKESIEEVYDAMLENYDEFEEVEDELLEGNKMFVPIIKTSGKVIHVGQPDGQTIPNGKSAEKTTKLADAKKEEVKQHPASTSKATPATKELSTAKTDLDDSKFSAKMKDNGKDEKDVTPPIIPGVDKADKNHMGNVHVPSFHKIPTRPQIQKRKVFDFEDFLKIINHK